MPSAQPTGLALLRDTAELFTESWLLAVDSTAVIWLRLGRLSGLDAAALAESERIVGEKARAAIELPLQVMSGAMGLTPPAIARRSLAYYRTRVSDNRRRLAPARAARNPRGT